MVLFQNQGDGSFAEVAGSFGAAINASGLAGWGSAFLDYDNDGWQDIVLATTQTSQNGDFLSEAPNQLLHNNGDGSFSDATPNSWGDVPTPSIGLATADFDNDGLVDFVSGDWNVGYKLHRNEGYVGADNNWLTIRLIGGGPVNRDAVGARVTVTTAGGHTQMQEVKIGSSLGSGNDTALHFGLGQESSIKDVRITWPNGFEHHFENAPVNQVSQGCLPDGRDGVASVEYLGCGDNYSPGSSGPDPGQLEAVRAFRFGTLEANGLPHRDRINGTLSC